ncbi:MAG: hypothetical protein KAW39_02335 [Thermoplasmata archaeon]|nr:hypothetical protein [Thermoplasmata archaeon]
MDIDRRMMIQFTALAGYGFAASAVILLNRGFWQFTLALVYFPTLVAVWLVVFLNMRWSKNELSVTLPLHVGTLMLPLIPVVAYYADAFSPRIGGLLYAGAVIMIGMVSVHVTFREREFRLLAASIGLVLAGFISLLFLYWVFF